MVEFDPKDPGDSSDFSLSWTGVPPIGSGDTIVSFDSVTISPVTDPPLVEAEADRTFTDTATRFWLSGGLAGTKYTIDLHVTTAGGRGFDRSATVKVKEL